MISALQMHEAQISLGLALKTIFKEIQMGHFFDLTFYSIRQNLFRHIIDSTGTSVRSLYLADALIL